MSLLKTQRRRKRQALPLALAELVALLVSPAGRAAEAFDPLTRPSAPSPRATALLHLDVARAGDRLVAVGERGSVLLSDDHGRNWRPVATPVSLTLVRVAFADAKRGWAAGHGGALLATADGGQTWTQRLDGTQAARVELDAARAGPGDPARTAEAQRLVQEGADKPWLALHPDVAGQVWAVGAYGLAMISADGGTTWHSAMDRLKAAEGRHLYGLHAGDGRVLLAGEQGHVLRSTDGGRTFARIEFPGKGTVFGILRLDAPSALLAYGLKGAAFRTTDDGSTWRRVELPPATILAAVRMHDGTVLLGDETGQLHRSDDDGRSFSALPARRPAPIAALVEAADGALVTAGAGGVSRVEWRRGKGAE